jgi:hypothetical protein
MDRETSTVTATTITVALTGSPGNTGHTLVTPGVSPTSSRESALIT